MNYLVNNRKVAEKTNNMSDTHKYGYNVQYKFTGEFSSVEAWLKLNCKGEFDIVIDKEPARPNSDGSLSIHFKKESDRNRFRDQVLQGF